MIIEEGSGVGRLAPVLRGEVVMAGEEGNESVSVVRGDHAAI
mgnify:CR=1 FL=1